MSATADMKVTAEPVELKKVTSHEAEAGVESAKEPELLFGFFPKKYVLLALFAIWFVLTAAYNVSNKKATKSIEISTFYLSWWQFFLGCPYVLFMWFTGLRKMPVLSKADLLKLAPLAVFHSMTHVCAVISMGAGHVSFTHIVKAAEPVTTAFLGMLVLQDFFPWQVYISMIPIMAGVITTACGHGGGDGSFALAFFGALGSCLGSSLRAIYSKKVMNGEPVGQNLTPANMYGVLTLMSTLLWGIFALPYGYTEFNASFWDSPNCMRYFLYATLSALCYYLYNEAAFVTLHKVAPLTHSVANTFKRIFIILSAVIFLGEHLDRYVYSGGAVAIIGVFVYSLVKQHYKKK